MECGTLPPHGSDDPVDLERVENSLQRLSACVDQPLVGLVPHLVVDLLRRADPPRWGERLDPRDEVDPITKEVLSAVDFSQVESDAEMEHLSLRDRGVAAVHRTLDRKRAIQSSEGARELDEEAVFCALDPPGRRVGSPRHARSRPVR